MAPPMWSGPLRLWARQRWLPFGVRDRVLRAFIHPDGGRSDRFECDFYGQRYPGDLSNFIDWTVFFYGAYEPGLLRFLADAAPPLGGHDAVFLDIGANVGQHTLFMAPRVAEVHAFEPWQPARLAVEEKIIRNRLANVRLHAVALSDEPGRMPYFAPTSGNRGTGSFLEAYNLSNRREDVLPVERGDDVLCRLGVTRVDLIKIDTEGFERRVLAGLGGTLERLRPVVVFELSPATGEDMAVDGDVATGVAQAFGRSWRFFRLAEQAEGYRLEPFAGQADGAMVVAVPEEKVKRVPQAGGR
jgi:FkbM family methyltransferase